MQQCQECSGKRVTGRMVPEVRSGISHPDGWAGRPVRVTYETGRMVERLSRCETCSGSGTAPDPVAPAERIARVSRFTIDGKLVDAPGFEQGQFVAFVERAKAAMLRTSPSTTPGAVMVLSGSSDAQYMVTRASCGCIGHQRVGRCYHRALAIWLADVKGVDITRIPTIGVSKRGLPLTTGRRVVA